MHDAEQCAELHAARSIRRFVKRLNDSYLKAGLRAEYDGRLIRCVVTDTELWHRRIASHEAHLGVIDPLCTAISSRAIDQTRQGVAWWYDLASLRARYDEMKHKVSSIAVANRERLADVPVVVGGDWEFNAWACPAGATGDFIMVNFGFIHAYCYAAMFLEMIDEARQAAEDGQSRGIVASSMIWMAAHALGYEALQWDNLALPPSEYDRIWNDVQHPSERLEHSITLIDAFALLHECGHIACGHTDVFRQWQPIESLDDRAKEERLRQSRDFEFEADAFACQSLRSLSADGKGFVEPLLILFSMLRLCEDKRNAQSALTMTHPVASDRFRACLVAFGQETEKSCRLLEMTVELALTASRRRVGWQAAQHDGSTGVLDKLT